jgi:hypothetical protein
MPRRTVLHEGETATAEIRVHRSATVTGRALRGGAPVGGADITVVTLGAALRDRRGMVSTHAAADGAFVVRGIVPGRLVVYAKAPEDDGSRTWDAFSDQVIESAAGRAAFAFDAAPGATVARDVEVRPSPPPKEPRESLDETVRDLVADEGRITVTGRITTADGRDLVEARVLAAGDAEFVGEMFAQNLARPVGAGGRFRIEGRVEGDSIAVRAADLWHDATTVIAKVPAGAHEVKVDLVLPARPVVRGSVTSGGNPVAGAFIGLGDGVVGRTAADGTFAVPAKSGAAWLSVRAPGFVSWLSRELKVPVEEPLQIELSAALAISGVVVDEKDAPVAGAVVTARRQEREEAGVATGADGAFRIAGLAPGSWTLRVAASPGAARDLAAKDAGAFDAGASKVRIVAHAGRRISGTFVGADGAGIASAKVTCRPGSAGEEEAETRTDAAGRFEFAGLSAGTFAISADPTSDDDLAVVHAETKSGGDPLLLRATAAPVVAGVLVDDAGKPVAGVELEAQRLDGDDEGWWSRPKAKTGADGKFRIVVKDGDRFRVALPRNSRVGDSREIVGGDDVPVGATDVKLVAKRLGGFDGIAVDPDGKPVAGVKVTIHVRHQDVEATSGEDGTFRIAPLGDWTGTLIARAPGRAPVQRFGVKPGAGEIRLEMKPEARFAGRLVEADGTAATHWTLRFVSPVYPGTDLWRVTPGPDGRFDVGEMCPGDWYAEAISTESKESVSLGKVTPGTTDAVLRLP